MVDMVKILREASTTTLGSSPVARCQLNGGAFVQDCLVTHRGWQYAAFYLDNRPGVRHVCLARRQLPSGAWDIITFTDYDQTEDDGHNVISLGICAADGSIHFSFDAHDTPLHYRHSLVDLTTDAANSHWRTESFSKVLDCLPGLEHLSKAEYFKASLSWVPALALHQILTVIYVLPQVLTYPRFVSVREPPGALVFEYRIGISGLGSDLLCVYSGNVDDEGSWRHRGVYLQGVQNNPYINGIDADVSGALHVSWTYRDYVPVTLEQSRQQAGPNGPENNHDLCYAYSPPEKDGTGPGLRWYASDGHPIGISSSSPILPSTEGILAFDIPKYSGILNQEAQCVTPRGGFHALNRELVRGLETWCISLPPGLPIKIICVPLTPYRILFRFVYSLMDGEWTKEPLPILPPSPTSARGKILVSRKSERLLALLPLAQDLLILTKTVHRGWETSLVIPDAGGEKGMEVLYDLF
ncbi:BZ3500_MvSof-1268-A1-R1_Chr3-2g06222 [Microbotryum saponariae]|uniref:BZ3500_MvSof-1268-A1-R1_Chr3-2g06222 protein n=1 Tax=Microbotryum saponariae TaxID=289078 RepID=A0A2X0KVJ1_9BASI|nr:BZ3500_MvSof-1268-A1-R1_Chr3-2g06222 [Microbotryum saponariae]SDA04145.1 BZ3501_MvSof-1269-A2-R1_Chr3-2g05913 [Microbotryum saponariae]